MAPQEVLAKDLAHPRHFLAIGEPTQESGLPKAKFVYHGYNEPAWQVGASTGKYPISSTAIQARSAAMTLAPEHCCPTTLVRDVVIDGSILAVQKVDDFHLCILVFQMERYSQKKWIYDNNRDTFKIDFCCTPLPKYWLHPPGMYVLLSCFVSPILQSRAAKIVGHSKSEKLTSDRSD